MIKMKKSYLNKILKYDKIKYLEDPEYRNSILFTFAMLSQY